MEVCAQGSAARWANAFAPWHADTAGLRPGGQDKICEGAKCHTPLSPSSTSLSNLPSVAKCKEKYDTSRLSAMLCQDTRPNAHV